VAADPHLAPASQASPTPRSAIAHGRHAAEDPSSNILGRVEAIVPLPPFWTCDVAGAGYSKSAGSSTVSSDVSIREQGQEQVAAITACSSTWVRQLGPAGIDRMIRAIGTSMVAFRPH
jgi:hypothetical protein